jgi:hypothetical protein
LVESTVRKASPKKTRVETVKKEVQEEKVAETQLTYEELVPVELNVEVVIPETEDPEQESSVDNGTPLWALYPLEEDHPFKVRDARNQFV